jgi:hypothetical protein
MPVWYQIHAVGNLDGEDARRACGCRALDLAKVVKVSADLLAIDLFMGILARR